MAPAALLAGAFFLGFLRSLGTGRSVGAGCLVSRAPGSPRQLRQLAAAVESEFGCGGQKKARFCCRFLGFVARS